LTYVNTDVVFASKLMQLYLVQIGVVVAICVENKKKTLFEMKTSDEFTSTFSKSRAPLLQT